MKSSEVIISIIFLALLVLVADPFMKFMSHSLAYILLLALVIIFALFAGFVWREKAADERESLHRLTAGRVGYLLGTAGLLVGIVAEGFSGHIDPWLLIALGAMILGKLLSFVWSRNKN